MHETNEEILNELRIEVAKQKENIGSLKVSVSKLDKQLCVLKKIVLIKYY